MDTATKGMITRAPSTNMVSLETQHVTIASTIKWGIELFIISHPLTAQTLEFRMDQ